MKQWQLFVLGLLMMSGCAMLSQVKSDYERGKSIPESASDTSIHAIVDTVKGSVPAPFTPIATIVGAVVLGVLTWNRGRKERQKLPTSSNPITGTIGEKIGAEAVVQHFSNFVTGLTDVGPENSAFRRGWKVFISFVVGLLATALTIPAVKEFVDQHWLVATVVGLIAAVFGAIDKAQQKVLPLEKPT